MDLALGDMQLFTIIRCCMTALGSSTSRGRRGGVTVGQAMSDASTGDRFDGS
ncbi:MAG: hypothetical protein V3V01_00325 [Acidimicrobiales bacterium]